MRAACRLPPIKKIVGQDASGLEACQTRSQASTQGLTAAIASWLHSLHQPTAQIEGRLLGLPSQLRARKA